MLFHLHLSVRYTKYSEIVDPQKLPNNFEYFSQSKENANVESKIDGEHKDSIKSRNSSINPESSLTGR